MTIPTPRRQRRRAGARAVFSGRVNVVSLVVTAVLGILTLCGARTTLWVQIAIAISGVLGAGAALIRKDDHGWSPRLAACAVVTVAVVTVGLVFGTSLLPKASGGDRAHAAPVVSLGSSETVARELRLTAKAVNKTVGPKTLSTNVTVALGDDVDIDLRLHNPTSASIPATLIEPVIDDNTIRFAVVDSTTPTSAALLGESEISLTAGRCFDTDEFGQSELDQVSGSAGVRAARHGLVVKNEFGDELPLLGSIYVPQLEAGATVHVTGRLQALHAEASATFAAGGALVLARNAPGATWVSEVTARPGDRISVFARAHITDCLLSYHTVGAFLRTSAKPDHSKYETVLTVSVATDEDGPYQRLSEVNLLWPDHAHPLDVQVVPGSTTTFGWSGAPDCDVQETPTAAPDGIDDRGLALGGMYGYKPHDPCTYDLDRAAEFTIAVGSET